MGILIFKKLTPNGKSFQLVIPKEWLLQDNRKLEGVNLDMERGKITITPVLRDSLTAKRRTGAKE